MSNIIYAVAGHGGKDPGAVSGKFIEKDLNLKVSEYFADYLKNYDCKVILGRTTDIYTTVPSRVAEAGKNNATLYIDIHHNAGGGKGCEVFYWHTDKKAKSFAEEVIKQFVQIGQKSRGIKASSEQSYNFATCRMNSKKGVTAILGEFAFVDNPDDQKMIDTDKKLKKEGEAYAKAVVNYLGLKAKPEPKPEVFSPGDIVKVIGTKWYNGKKIPSFVKYKFWQVKSVSGDRVIIDKSVDGEHSINSPINAKDLERVVSYKIAPSIPPKIQFGDTVTINVGARDMNTNKKLAWWAYFRKYKVREVSGNRAVVTYNGVIIAAIHINDLKKR